jgi:hypothetical protein
MPAAGGWGQLDKTADFLAISRISELVHCHVVWAGVQVIEHRSSDHVDRPNDLDCRIGLSHRHAITHHAVNDNLRLKLPSVLSVIVDLLTHAFTRFSDLRK